MIHHEEQRCQTPQCFTPLTDKTYLKDTDNDVSSNDYLSNNEVGNDWSEVRQGTQDAGSHPADPQQRHPHLWYAPGASKSSSPYWEEQVDQAQNGFEAKKPISRDDIDAGARIDHYLEMHTGGSLVRIKPTEVNPFKNKWSITDGKIGAKTAIKTFTPKSRRNLLKKLACINQDRIPENMVHFLTLTIDGNDTPSQCKKYLNNFLTQLRTRLEGHRWFYVWKAEFQQRGVLHFHIVILNVATISHKWIRHTWSRITLGYEEYKKRLDASDDQKEVFKSLVITDIEPSRNWGRTQEYFSKTLGYVSKNGEEEQELISKFNKEDRCGRWWGIGQGEVYRSFVNRELYNINDGEWYKIKRVFIKCIKAQWRKKHKGKFDYTKWKAHERYLKQGEKEFKHKIVPNEIRSKTKIWRPEPEIWLFMHNDTMHRLLRCLFPTKEIMVGDPVPKSMTFKEWVRCKEEM